MFENSNVSIDKSDVAKLLGRPLTAKEDAGYEAYIEIASVQLKGLLGYEIEISEEDTSTTRTFYGRAGFRSVITMPFKEASSIKVNGTEVTFKVGNSNRPFTYEIVTEFPLCEGDTVEVTASWGFGECPGGLMLLLANMFSVVANGQSSGGASKVKSETVLSHSTTFTTNSQYSEFLSDNNNLINLYKLPNQIAISPGRVIWGGDDDLSGYRPYF